MSPVEIPARCRLELNEYFVDEALLMGLDNPTKMMTSSSARVELCSVNDTVSFWNALLDTTARLDKVAIPALYLED